MLCLSISIGVSIFAIIFIKALPFIEHGLYPLFETEWLPHKKKLGVLNFIWASVYVTGIAIFIATPCGIFSSLFISEYLGKKTRNFTRIIIDGLSGISPVVYGAWGVSVVVPAVSKAALFLQSMGFEVRNLTGFSVMSAGIVLSIMILPVIVSISIEVLRSVPAELREMAFSLGATKWDVTRLVLKKSRSGVIAAIILATSRAIGETIAVIMVAGCTLNLTPVSIFDPAYPIPALIANTYGELMSVPFYESAVFMLAVVLLIVSVAFNALSAYILSKLKQ